MTILINGRFITQPLTGVQRVANEIVKVFEKKSWQTPKGHQLSLVGPKRFVSDRFHNQFGLLSGQAWEQTELFQHCKNKPLLNLANSAPMLKNEQIVCIHDAAVYDFPKSFSKKFLAFYKQLLPNIARNSRHVVTVSAFSRDRLIQYLPELSSKISVVHNGVNKRFKPSSDHEIETLKQRFNLTRPFILYLGSREPRKNIQMLIEAWQMIAKDFPEYDLLIAGRYQKHFKGIELKLSNQVKLIESPDDDILPSLYSAATLFVYPSLYEGFGLPPIEAMACGTAVISSNNSAIRDIASEALLVNPEKKEDISEAIKEVLTNNQLRKELETKGLIHSQKYSWDQAAEQYLKLIDQTF